MLASFPHNMPPQAQLASMSFNLYEQARPGDNGTSPAKAVRKRVLKSAYKAVRYQASSMNADCKARSQTSDYYIGVFDAEKNKCYAVPVDTAYQLTQQIAGFQQAFGVSNE